MTELCPDVTCGAAMVVREDEYGGFWHCRSCGQDVEDPDMNVRCRGCLNRAHRCDCGPYPNPWPVPESTEPEST
jgi:DNA-directed RNA polymerase subunit M/transcription elongation factor TFIIS